MILTVSLNRYDGNETMIIDADFVLLSVGQSIEWGNP